MRSRVLAPCGASSVSRTLRSVAGERLLVVGDSCGLKEHVGASNRCRQRATRPRCTETYKLYLLVLGAHFDRSGIVLSGRNRTICDLFDGREAGIERRLMLPWGLLISAHTDNESACVRRSARVVPVPPYAPNVRCRARPRGKLYVYVQLAPARPLGTFASRRRSRAQRF